jgi:predicted nucleotide-binding protein (sugar kinase/HSP70/actin superfamily)
MYTKLHRIVIDSLDGFQNMPITYITCADNYSADGLIEPESQPALVRNAVYAFLVSDVLNRILWRTRPYEKHPGQADAVFEEGLSNLIRLFELHGRQAEGGPVLDELERIATAAEAVIDPGIPPKPLIGLVGEIYLRSHCESNKDLIRLLERHGAEVVNASITEWIHFVIYDLMQKAGRETAHAVRRRNFRAAYKHAREWARQRITLTYQELRMSQVYRRVRHHLPIHADHRIANIERRLDDDRVFSFRMGTEAALSIGGALEYAAHGCDGIVNVFPFGCMPSTTCSAVLKPILDRLHVPYIDSSYDGTDQPNREAIVRTFMYQAAQHRKSSTLR